MASPPAEGQVHRFAARAADRLDRVIADAIPDVSRTRARKLIEDGAVTLGDAVVTRASQLAAEGDVVAVAIPPEPTLPAGVPDGLTVLYEDEHTLVIDKVPGLVVHPAPGLHEITLVDIVRARYPEVREIDDSDRPGVVHRLDRDTSGVMVVAKSAEAQHMLKEQWREREPSKVYLALVEGAPDPAAGIIEAPLGQDPMRPGRRAVIEGGQSARSEYRVLEQYGDEAALLLVTIFTGRTHQIRVHMAAVGYPVIADVMYGRPAELIGRQALHAWRLGFTLASTGERRTFEAPVPADLQRAIDALRERHGLPARALPALHTARGGSR